MPRIKAVIAAGVPPAEAVKAALGMTIREFAETYRVSESAVSGVINGSTPYLYARVRDALARHLEVERAYIDEILPPPRRAATQPGTADATGAAAADPPAAADPGAGADDECASAAAAPPTGPGVGKQGRRGRQERRAMDAPATTPARGPRPATAGIAQCARDWLRLADPAAVTPDFNRALAALAP